MTDEHTTWFRDPLTVVKSILSNPDFAPDFDYGPYQEFVGEKRRWTNFMSGNWCWTQAVRINFFVYLLLTYRIPEQDRRGSSYTRRHVCANHPWIGQDDRLGRYRPERILARIFFYWKCEKQRTARTPKRYNSLGFPQHSEK